jgi:hypothetical protein
VSRWVFVPKGIRNTSEDRSRETASLRFILGIAADPARAADRGQDTTTPRWLKSGSNRWMEALPLHITGPLRHEEVFPFAPPVLIAGRRAIHAPRAGGGRMPDVSYRSQLHSLGSSYKKHSWNKSANLRTAVGAKSSAGPMLVGADLTRYRSFRIASSAAPVTSSGAEPRRR